jgi:hypothetical protein
VIRLLQKVFSILKPKDESLKLNTIILRLLSLVA